MNQREKDIVSCVMVGMYQKEIAEKLGISRERVRQIINKLVERGIIKKPGKHKPTLYKNLSKAITDQIRCFEKVDRSGAC